MTIWAAETWPGLAKSWYLKFEHHFWQQGSWISGFREYPKSVQHSNLMMDVDAGPVVYGIGTTASAFGIGAARTLGRFDHAHALGTQAFAAMLPMANHRLLGPLQLSRVTDAPFTGEAIMLFNFTRRPMPGATVIDARRATPGIVYLVFGGLGITSVLLVVLAVGRARSQFRHPPALSLPYPRMLFGLWLVIIAIGLALLVGSQVTIGIVCLLLGQLLPLLQSSKRS